MAFAAENPPAHSVSGSQGSSMNGSFLSRERNDVQPALKKIWKAHEHTDGLVTRSISPYQLNLFGSFVKALPKKLQSRFIEHGIEIIMSVAIVYGTYTAHKRGFEQLHKDHRD